MIKYLEHGEIRKNRWDDCIAGAFNGCVYAYSWYLDIVCPAWGALVEDDYLRVMPLPFFRKCATVYSMQPVFTQQLGVFSKDELTPDLIENFIKAIPDEFLLIDYNLNIHNQLQPGNYKLFPMADYELNMADDYEKLKSGYSQNTRRNLRKGAENRLVLSTGIKPDDVVKLFRNGSGKEYKNLGDKQYATLLRLVYQCLSRGMAVVWGVYDRHLELCAGAIWVFSHQKAIFLFSGLSDKGRLSGAMPFLIDNFIREHAGSRLTLDFEGSNNEGLARFYAGFGSSRLIYPRLVINRLPLAVKIALPVVRRIRNIF